MTPQFSVSQVSEKGSNLSVCFYPELLGLDLMALFKLERYSPF
jgi:hypothetical protein